MGADDLRVTVAWSPRAGEVDEREVWLPSAHQPTAEQAVLRSGLLSDYPALSGVLAGAARGARSMGVWGRVCEPSTLLQAGDRVEIYRPLQVDPMEARRRRQRAGVTRSGG